MATPVRFPTKCQRQSTEVCDARRTRRPPIATLSSGAFPTLEDCLKGGANRTASGAHRVTKQLGLGVFATIVMMFSVGLRAEDGIQIGPVDLDAPTLCCLGLVVPITSGDDNYNATATVEFKASGSTTWARGDESVARTPRHTWP